MTACFLIPTSRVRLGYALAKHFFLSRIDVVAAPSIWGAGLAQWVAYFLEPRRPVIYARHNDDGGYYFTPGPEYLDGKRVLIIDNLILTGGTIQEFRSCDSAAGGTPVSVGALADLSGLDYPINVYGLLNDVLGLFDPERSSGPGSGDRRRRSRILGSRSPGSGEEGIDTARSTCYDARTIEYPCAHQERWRVPAL